MSSELRKAELRREIAWCDMEWDRLLQPSLTGATVNNYHRWSLSKLSYVVDIQDRRAKAKRELRKLRFLDVLSFLRLRPTSN